MENKNIFKPLENTKTKFKSESMFNTLRTLLNDCGFRCTNTTYKFNVFSNLKNGQNAYIYINKNKRFSLGSIEKNFLNSNSVYHADFDVVNFLRSKSEEQAKKLQINHPKEITKQIKKMINNLGAESTFNDYSDNESLFMGDVDFAKFYPKTFPNVAIGEAPMYGLDALKFFNEGNKKMNTDIKIEDIEIEDMKTENLLEAKKQVLEAKNNEEVKQAKIIYENLIDSIDCIDRQLKTLNSTKDDLVEKLKVFKKNNK